MDTAESQEGVHLEKLNMCWVSLRDIHDHSYIRITETLTTVQVRFFGVKRMW